MSDRRPRLRPLSLARVLSSLGALPVVIVALLGAACGRGPAYGSDNAVIAVVDPALRERLEPVLRQSLEREVFTTRPEPVFEVTFTTPADIGEFRKWRRIVVIEPTADPVLLPDLIDVPDQGPVVADVEDVWAREQRIWVLAGDTPAATAELVSARADSLYQALLDQFLAHHAERMWASGRDSALAGRLRDSLGFSLLLPRVYESAPGSAPADSRVWYNEDPRRVIAIHWLPRPDSLTADTVLAVRRAWGRGVYPGETIATAPNDPDSLPSDTLEPISASPEIRIEETRLDGLPALRIQGVWRTEDGTGAGLFLTYGVICGERLVLLDGNLYAPDRNKVPYLFQLERVLTTFGCGGADMPAGENA